MTVERGWQMEGRTPLLVREMAETTENPMHLFEDLLLHRMRGRSHRGAVLQMRLDQKFVERTNDSGSPSREVSS